LTRGTKGKGGGFGYIKGGHLTPVPARHQKKGGKEEKDPSQKRKLSCLSLTAHDGKGPGHGGREKHMKTRPRKSKGGKKKRYAPAIQEG